MKYAVIIFYLMLFSCSRDPFPAKPTPETFWIDADTHSDTIITNVNNQYPVIYYAEKNWQTSSDTNFKHGYRFIAMSFGDSIIVKLLNDSTGNYFGPFFITNEPLDTLRSQNFLDTINTTASRLFKKLEK